MRARITIDIDPAKQGKLAMIDLSEALTRLAAKALLAGFILPLTVKTHGGAIAEMTIEGDAPSTDDQLRAAMRLAKPE